MTAISLLFVGATLFINGIAYFLSVDKRSLGCINLLTGCLLFLLNTFYLLLGAYYSAATGFLFAFTYLLVGASYWFDLDMKVYGLFALFVAINTVPCAIYSLLVERDPIFAGIWLAWGLLWFTGFLEYVLGKSFGRFTPYFTIFCGIFTTWLPGGLQLLNLWLY